VAVRGNSMLLCRVALVPGSWQSTCTECCPVFTVILGVQFAVYDWHRRLPADRFLGATWQSQKVGLGGVALAPRAVAVRLKILSTGMNIGQMKRSVMAHTYATARFWISVTSR